jgi:hypothetical protein
MTNDELEAIIHTLDSMTSEELAVVRKRLLADKREAEGLDGMKGIYNHPMSTPGARSL